MEKINNFLLTLAGGSILIALFMYSIIAYQEPIGNSNEPLRSFINTIPVYAMISLALFAESVRRTISGEWRFLAALSGIITSMFTFGLFYIWFR